MSGQIIGYIRVSTIDQNIDRQIEQLKHCEYTFIDKVSGKDIERPQLQAMLHHIRKGDVIEVCSIDRLARNNVDLQSLVKTINAKGVTIKFLKEGLTFSHDVESNPISKMMLTMLAAIGEFERELIRERQREGIAIAKANGKYKGRKPKLNAKQIDEIHQRITNGQNKTQIAKDFGITRATLYSYLAQNEAARTQETNNN